MLWDDDAHLTAAALRPVAGLWRIWFDLGATQQYYPVVHSAFWLMHRLWGDVTTGYHLVTILLHATSAYLIVVALTRLAVPGALLAGFAFALHPVHVESVAWMTELKNTLSTVFYLAAALSYLRFDERRAARDWYRAAAFSLLALGSKTVTATLPVALAVVIWWKRGVISWRRDLRPLVPFLLAGVAGGALTAWVEYSLIGAQGAGYELRMFDRVLLAGRAVWFYLASLVWPAHLVFIYPRWTVTTAVWWQWLFPAALAAILALLWRLRTTTRAPLAALLLFCVTLGPALGFLNVYPFRYSFVADHFQYAASIPVLAALAAALTATAVRWVVSPPARAVLAALVLAPLGALTWQVSHHYQTEEALFRSVVARNPSAWMAHSRLAMIEVEKPAPDIAVALAHAREAVRSNPQSAEVHDTLGLLLQSRGQYADARAAFETASRLSPALVGPHRNLGILAYAEGRLDEALRHLEEASRLDPNDADVRRALGVVAAERAGPADPAAAALRAGGALERQGRLEEAEAQYRTALGATPDSPGLRDALGYLLVQKGAFAEAVIHLTEAVRLQPTAAAAHASLAYALREVGRLGDSIAAYRRAVAFPENAASASVRNNYGITLAMAGQRDEARAEFREALRLDPALTSARDNLMKVGGP
jgi:Flp pilus assembly protein TadD